MYDLDISAIIISDEDLRDWTKHFGIYPYRKPTNPYRKPTVFHNNPLLPTAVSHNRSNP
jgi:hypothetical protein